MKKYFISICLIIFTFNTIAQIDCKWFDSSSVLIARLKQKPTGGISYYRFINNCNITDSVKKELLHCLDWHWTKYEELDYLERYFEANTANQIIYNNKFISVDDYSKFIAKKNDSIYKVTYDSIKNNIIETERANINYKVDDDIINGAAYIYLKEAIPILHKALKDTTHYNIEAVELALARLGNKKLQKKVIENCKIKEELIGRDWIDYNFFKPFDTLIFILSQESIFKIAQSIDTVKTYYSGNRIRPIVKTARSIIILLQRCIKNKDFQEILNGFDFDYFDISNSLILKCKNWLFKNKGKYQLNSLSGMGGPYD